MSPSLRPLLILLLVGLGLCAAEPTTPPFEADIRAFVEADRRQPPKRDGILFVGSSIFREWTNVTEMMAPLPVVNRAFGGSRTGHQLARFDQVVTPHAPRVTREIQPGDIVAVSATNLQGVYLEPEDRALMARLRALEPIGRVGWSIRVYRADFTWPAAISDENATTNQPRGYTETAL